MDELIIFVSSRMTSAGRSLCLLLHVSRGNRRLMQPNHSGFSQISHVRTLQQGRISRPKESDWCLFLPYFAIKKFVKTSIISLGNYPHNRLSSTEYILPAFESPSKSVDQIAHGS